MFAVFIFGPDNTTPIQMGATPLIIGLRVMVSIMMHLNVEADTRQGLNMMKYLVNHPEDFTSPVIAYMVGFEKVIISFTDTEHGQNQNTVPSLLIGKLNNQKLFFGHLKGFE